MTGGMEGTNDDVDSLIVGRDLSDAEVQAGTIGNITVGRQLSAALTSNTSIGAVVVGGQIEGGNITAEDGSIASVTAGEADPYAGGPWMDQYTANGSITSLTIHASGEIGSLSVQAAIESPISMRKKFKMRNPIMLTMPTL